eukprot:COSAG02_NODE_195_length_29750_cov_79.793329_23_plen_43_part_00
MQKTDGTPINERRAPCTVTRRDSPQIDQRVGDNGSYILLIQG